MGGAHVAVGRRLERRVRHSVPDPELSRPRGPDVGRERPAEHPPPQRDRLLGAVAPSVQPAAAVAGGATVRDSPAGVGAQPEDRPVRRRRPGAQRRAPPHARAGRRRHRSEVRRHPRPDPRPDLRHGLRAGRGGPAADQSRSLQPVLSRETTVLSRERRRFLGEQRPAGGRGQPGSDGAVLQPWHRHRSGRTGDPDSRGRPSLGQAVRLGVGRSAQHADRSGGRARAREQLHRGAGVSRPAEQLADRRDLRQPAGDRRFGRKRRLQPHLRGGRTGGDWTERADRRVRRH